MDDLYLALALVIESMVLEGGVQLRLVIHEAFIDLDGMILVDHSRLFKRTNGASFAFNIRLVNSIV